MTQTEGDLALLAEVNEWQLIVQDFLEVELGGWSPEYNAVYYTGRSLDDALAESVSGEIFLFVITCGLGWVGSVGPRLGWFWARLSCLLFAIACLSGDLVSWLHRP